MLSAAQGGRALGCVQRIAATGWQLTARVHSPAPGQTAPWLATCGGAQRRTHLSHHWRAPAWTSMKPNPIGTAIRYQRTVLRKEGALLWGAARNNIDAGAPLEPQRRRRGLGCVSAPAGVAAHGGTATGEERDGFGEEGSILLKRGRDAWAGGGCSARAGHRPWRCWVVGVRGAWAALARARLRRGGLDGCCGKPVTTGATAWARRWVGQQANAAGEGRKWVVTKKRQRAPCPWCVGRGNRGEAMQPPGGPPPPGPRGGSIGPAAWGQKGSMLVGWRNVICGVLPSQRWW
jgi:hypothetical protein